jgi:parallel beta-helix repeat protein
MGGTLQRGTGAPWALALALGGASFFGAASAVVLDTNGLGDTFPILTDGVNTALPTSNDLVGIQNAIDLASGLGGKGGTVFLPGGVYTIEDSIVLPSSVRLVGAGPFTGAGGTLIRYLPSAGASPNSHAVEIVGREFCEVRDLTIQADPTNGEVWGGAILLRDSDNCVVQRVHLLGFKVGTFTVGETFASKASDPGSNGVGVRLAGNSRANRIENCRIEDSNAGIVFEMNARGNLVRDNRFGGFFNSGVYLAGAQGNSLLANRMRVNKTYAFIEGVDASRNQFLWNILEHGGAPGFGPDPPTTVHLGFIDRVRGSVGNLFLQNITPDARAVDVTGLHALAGMGRRAHLYPQLLDVQDLARGGRGQARYRFAVPDDWDRTSDFTLQLMLEEIGSQAGTVELVLEVAQHRAGGPSSSTSLSISKAVLANTKHETDPARGTISVEADTDWVELKLTRSGGRADTAGVISIELALAEYSGTHFAYSRTSR